MNGIDYAWLSLRKWVDKYIKQAHIFFNSFAVLTYLWDNLQWFSIKLSTKAYYPTSLTGQTPHPLQSAVGHTGDQFLDKIEQTTSSSAPTDKSCI